jgi:hypothetical protein
MVLEGEQQRFGRHGGDQLQGDYRLTSGLPHQLSCQVAIENDAIDRLIGRPRFGADGDSTDLRTGTELRRTAYESRIRGCVSACQAGKGGGLAGMGAEAPAQQAADVDATIGDEAVAGLGIFLVEEVVAEGEEDRSALDTRGGLDNVGMMADDQVRAMLDEPARLLLLRIGGPVLQFVAPVDGDNDQVGELAGETQLLR